MIIETITVTTTPTSILALLNTARSTTRAKNNLVDSIMFRIDSTSTKVVSIEEVDTDTAVTLLDPANTQPFAAFEAFNLEESLLSVDSATVAVGIIASQK